jgi:ubiquinone/menaquinone biosynthesis C-methylase UbiE
MAVNKKYWEVVQSNVLLHSSVAGHYNTSEPHFRPENIARVESILIKIIKSVQGRRLLDLGCGTGFIISIAKNHVQEITGIDVTQEMLEKVDTTGNCRITLLQHDTGTVSLPAESFDVATGYSFFHHLYDIVPTLKTAFKALRKGGKLYADLEPNYYFWKEINKLTREGNYDFIVKREIEAVTYKDEDIAKTFGVNEEVFNSAEYGKSTKGGFKEELLLKVLKQIGFRDVEFQYNWFIGQGVLINDDRYSKEERFKYAQVMDDILQRAKPLSRSLYKYLGFMASK